MRATWGERPIFGPDLDLAVNRPDTKAGPFPTCIPQRPPGLLQTGALSLHIYIYCIFIGSYVSCIYFTGPARARGRAISWGLLLWRYVPNRMHIQPQPGVHARQQRQQRCRLGIHVCTFTPAICHACGLTGHQRGADASSKFRGD